MAQAWQVPADYHEGFLFFLLPLNLKDGSILAIDDPDPGSVCLQQKPAEGPRSRPATRTGTFLAVLSKQIKDVRALKDDGGCFYVLLQAAVAPIGLEERVMGLKHSACSQMRDTLNATSKHAIIYILAIHTGRENNPTSKDY